MAPSSRDRRWMAVTAGRENIHIRGQALSGLSCRYVTDALLSTWIQAWRTSMCIDEHGALMRFNTLGQLGLLLIHWTVIVASVRVLTRLYRRHSCTSWLSFDAPETVALCGSKYSIPLLARRACIPPHLKHLSMPIQRRPTVSTPHSLRYSSPRHGYRTLSRQPRLG